MFTIDSYESFEASLLNIQGLPLVLEALWELDAEGWHLGFYVYASTGPVFNTTTTRHTLGLVAITDDGKSSVEQVSPWPEAKLAQQIGQRAIEKYGITFYFPSDQIPNDQCPSWIEQQPIECLDCHQAFTPGHSLDRANAICTNCHITRQTNELNKNTELNNGANLYFYKDGVYESIFSCSHMLSIPTIPYIHYFISVGDKMDSVREVTLDQQQIIALQATLQQDIEANLATYQQSTLRQALINYAKYVTGHYQGVAYELEINFNQAHRDLADMISFFNDVERALSEGWLFKFYLKAGVTNRADTLLRYVCNLSNGQTTKAAMKDHFKNLLSEEEITDTVSQLETNHCLLVKDGDIFITNLGKHIL